jgi:quercetin dioxygenase-like cupin family protein
MLAGDVNMFMATGEDTNGAYAQWEVLVPPGGGPPPHVHSREEECIYVLDGEVILRIGDSRTVAQAGTFVGLPVNVPHAFKNESDLPARLLFTVAPAGLEGFFFEAGRELSSDGGNAASLVADDLDRLHAAAVKYGITFLPPHAPDEKANHQTH